MHPPITDNYSTMDITEASVCEVPILKVTKWIENNDSLHPGDLLNTKSFDSLATSQMIAYICENDKKKIKAPCAPLPDYIEQTSCQQSFSKVDDLSSIQRSCSDSDDVSVHQSTTSQLCPYYDESTVKKEVQQKDSFSSSLPGYMREVGDQTDNSDDSSTDMSNSSLSLDCLSLPGGNYHCKRPQDLQLTKEQYMPYVTNSNCSKMSCDPVPQATNLSCLSKNDLDDCGDDSGLNTATTTMELSESHFGYYGLPSDEFNSEADVLSKSCQSSTSDLFELDDDDIDSACHNIAIFDKHLTLKSVSDDDAQSSPASHVGCSSISEQYFDNEVNNVRKASAVYSSGISSGYVELPLENDECFCAIKTQNHTSSISHCFSSDV